MNTKTTAIFGFAYHPTYNYLTVDYSYSDGTWHYQFWKNHTTIGDGGVIEQGLEKTAEEIAIEILKGEGITNWHTKDKYSLDDFREIF